MTDKDHQSDRSPIDPSRETDNLDELMFIGAPTDCSADTVASIMSLAAEKIGDSNKEIEMELAAGQFDPVALGQQTDSQASEIHFRNIEPEFENLVDASPPSMSTVQASPEDNLEAKQSASKSRPRVIDWLFRPMFGPGVLGGAVVGSIFLALISMQLFVITGTGGNRSLQFKGQVSGEPDRMGAGLKDLFIDSQESGVANEASKRATSTDPVRASFEFYTVLPDVERVVSVEETMPQQQLSKEPVKQSVKNQDSDGYYMLQVGSYSKQSIAEKMKENLAITGFEPAIQRVNIQGQGQFFRVQVGPFMTMGSLEKANRKLEQMGFKTLWLKVSKRP